MVAYDAQGPAAIARKIFPLRADTDAQAAYLPFEQDADDPGRIVRLPNGDNAVLSACYDAFAFCELDRTDREASSAAVRRCRSRRLPRTGGRRSRQAAAEVAASGSARSPDGQFSGDPRLQGSRRRSQSAATRFGDRQRGARRSVVCRRGSLQRSAAECDRAKPAGRRLSRIGLLFVPILGV